MVDAPSRLRRYMPGPGGGRAPGIQEVKDRQGDWSLEPASREEGGGVAEAGWRGSSWSCRAGKPVKHLGFHAKCNAKLLRHFQDSC